MTKKSGQKSCLPRPLRRESAVKCASQRDNRIASKLWKKNLQAEVIKELDEDFRLAPLEEG